MFGLVAWFVTVPTQSSAQQRSRAEWLDDPIFGLPINVNQTHYEPMPTRVRKLCRKFPPGKFWVFASHHLGDTEYLIVSGFVPNAEGDPVGNVVVIQGTRCSGETVDWLAAAVVPTQGYGADTATYLLPGQGAPSTCYDHGDCRYTLRSPREEAVVRALARDALARGARAWGAQAFRKQACAPTVRADNAKASQIFSQELEEHCSSK